MTICALHGFLGRPKDWHDFDFEAKLNAIDLFDPTVFPHSRGLMHCAQNFITNEKEKQILMGYSLGGRFALHLLMQQPSLWKGAIFISTHPGLQQEEEKQIRLDNDLQWAKHFQSESWETLIQHWNSQNVFKGEQKARVESEYHREVLSDVLKSWSLGHQKDFTKELESIDLPILWIVGTEDQRYAAIAEKLSWKSPLSRTWLAPHVAHRVPWEAPTEFQQQINQFLIELNRFNH